LNFDKLAVWPGCGLDNWGIVLLLLTWTRDLSLPQNHAIHGWDHPGSYSLNVGWFVCHWQNRWADHSPPSTDKLKNVWNYASTSPHTFVAWCLIKQRENLLSCWELPPLHYCFHSPSQTMFTFAFLWDLELALNDLQWAFHGNLQNRRLFFVCLQTKPSGMWLFLQCLHGKYL